jgi:hypothetical protein
VTIRGLVCDNIFSRPSLDGQGEFRVINGILEDALISNFVVDNATNARDQNVVYIGAANGAVTARNVTFSNVQLSGASNSPTTNAVEIGESATVDEVRIRNGQFRNVRNPYVLNGHPVEVDGKLGGAEVDGLDLGSVSGTYIGQIGVSDGSTNSAGKLYRWDGGAWNSV